MEKTDELTLRWKNPADGKDMAHNMRFWMFGVWLKGELEVVKKNGTQKIAIVIIEPRITIESIEASWKKQNEKWIELGQTTMPPFIAARAFQLEFQVCIFWHVLHFDDTPFDNVLVRDNLNVKDFFSIES